MAEYREVLYERLYVKVPGTEKLRKTADGRLRYLLSTGWREVDRIQKPDHLVVHVERTGQTPLKGRLPKGPPPQQRMDRRPRNPNFGGPRGRR